MRILKETSWDIHKEFTLPSVTKTYLFGSSNDAKSSYKKLSKQSSHPEEIPC